MADTKVFAHAVVAIVSRRKNGHEQIRHRRVGTLLENAKSDLDRGPPFVLMLDKTFNPAGVLTDQSEVAISFYWDSRDSNAAATG